MLSEEQLFELSRRLHPLLADAFSLEELHRLLNGYNQAYPDLRLSDVTGNCRGPGQTISYWYDRTARSPKDWATHQGRLVAVLEEKQRQPDGSEVFRIKQVIVLMDGQRHRRVNWPEVLTKNSKP